MKIKKTKKIISGLLSIIMIISTFSLTACNKDEEGSGSSISSEYNGILSKIRLGMPLTKIVGLQRDGVSLYYETDTVIWAVDNDTDLMEAATYIPEAKNMFYYVDDSLITYNFRTQKGDSEIYLNGYTEEVYCLLDRVSGNDYFKDKTVQLSKQHSAAAVGSMTGTENIDMQLTSKMKFDCPSYEVLFTMVETFDTVDDIEDYYVTYYKIEVKEKLAKTETSIQGVTLATEAEK